MHLVPNVSTLCTGVALDPLTRRHLFTSTVHCSNLISARVNAILHSCDTNLYLHICYPLLLTYIGKQWQGLGWRVFSDTRNCLTSPLHSTQALVHMRTSGYIYRTHDAVINFTYITWCFDRHMLLAM